MQRKARLLVPYTAAVSRLVQPAILSVQRGVLQWSGALTATATILPVNLANAVISFNGNAVNVNTLAWHARVELTNSTTVTAVRQDNGAGVTQLSWEVIEYAPGVIRSVQRGASTLTAAAGTNVTITAVSALATTSVDMLGYTAPPAGASALTLPLVTLTAPTTLTMTSGGLASGLLIGWQVTEWN